MKMFFAWVILILAAFAAVIWLAVDWILAAVRRLAR